MASKNNIASQGLLPAVAGREPHPDNAGIINHSSISVYAASRGTVKRMQLKHRRACATMQRVTRIWPFDDVAFRWVCRYFGLISVDRAHRFGENAWDASALTVHRRWFDLPFVEHPAKGRNTTKHEQHAF
jgi:hypothetical protein